MANTSAVEHALFEVVRQRLVISIAAIRGWVKGRPAMARNLLCLSLALVASQAVIAIPVVETIFPAVLPNCTVGYSGTAVNVSYTGFGSDRECQNLETIDPAFVRAGSGGSVICRVQLGGVLAIVRDRGSYTYTGSAICAYLTRRSTSLGDDA
jgi:hypothetical protein